LIADGSNETPNAENFNYSEMLGHKNHDDQSSASTKSSYGTISLTPSNCQSENVRRYFAWSDFQGQASRHRSFSRTMIAICSVIVFAILLAFTLRFHLTDRQSVQCDGLTRLKSLVLEETEDEWVFPMLSYKQRLNHFDSLDQRLWTHKFFVSDRYFKGPGYPIIVIIGGESLVRTMHYPFVYKRLANELGAFVVQTEHRFYGTAQPLGRDPRNEDLAKYFTPEQAVQDNIKVIQHVRKQLNCSTNKYEKGYCPVITIGCSYPGFLSAILRLAHPEIVDIGYAASAPMIVNAHHENFDTNAYFDHVSKVAETAYPGCAQGSKRMMKSVYEYLVSDESIGHLKRVVMELGICFDTIPQYMLESNQVFATELNQLIVQLHADYNMEYYPPSPKRILIKACEIVTNDHFSPTKQFANLLQLVTTTGDYQEAALDRNLSASCFDLQTQVPFGANATISAADWTGAGYGVDGERWEFQVCKDLVIKTGFGSENNMFYPRRNWTLEWLTDHCRKRFGITPQPGRLVNMWHFDDYSNASMLLFTNGLKDGWSVGSYTKSPTVDNSVVVYNFPNGAHHSDLRHKWPTGDDTEDIIEGHEHIMILIRNWLMEIAVKNGKA